MVDADLNLAILSFSGDYTYNSTSGSNGQGQNNPTTDGTRSTIRLGSKVTFQWSPTILYGLDVTATHSNGTGGGNVVTNGNTNASQEVSSLAVGPFVRGNLSRAADFSLAGGLLLIDTEPSIPPNYFFAGVLRYQLNRHLRLILSASHDVIFTTGTDLTEETNFRAGTQFDLTRFISFTAFPFLTVGNEKTGDTPGAFSQYGIEASLDWKPRRRWTASLTYDFVRRDSDVAVNNYVQNTLLLEVRYKF